MAAPCYRVCEFAAGVGGWASVIGGLSIAYATIPMNKRTGITIGGTTYFMTGGRVVGISRLHFSRNSSALERSPERKPGRCPITTCRRILPPQGQSRRATSQRENISGSAYWPTLSTRLGRIRARWHKPYRSLSESHVIRSLWSTHGHRAIIGASGLGGD